MSDFLRGFVDMLKALNELDDPGNLTELYKAMRPVVQSSEELPSEIRDRVMEALDALDGQALSPFAFRKTSTEGSEILVAAFHRQSAGMERFDAVLMGFGPRDMSEYYVALSVHPRFDAVPREVAAWAKEQIAAAGDTVFTRTLSSAATEISKRAFPTKATAL